MKQKKMTNSEAFNLLELRGAPIATLFGLPFLFVLLTVCAVPMLVEENTRVIATLEDLVRSNWYFSPIDKDAYFAGYPRSKFIVQMCLIYILGPTLTLWVLFRTNNHVLDIKIFKNRLATILTRVLGWGAVLIGAVTLTYFNDHKVGFCAGCEYNSFFTLSLSKSMSFPTIGWAVLQITANLKLIGNKK